VSPENLIQNAIAPALRILPAKMDSDAAIAMMVAIGLQESRLEHRAQIGGPARGYWQFELGGGVRGVLTHPASKPHIQAVLTALDYDPASDPAACYAAIEHNDALAAAFARLLLWTLPEALPARTAPGSGWSQYLSAWRPGRPHPDLWPAYFADAWDLAALA
jgi:hypothetical protein